MYSILIAHNLMWILLYSLITFYLSAWPCPGYIDTKLDILTEYLAKAIMGKLYSVGQSLPYPFPQQSIFGWIVSQDIVLDIFIVVCQLVREIDQSLWGWLSVTFNIVGKFPRYAWWMPCSKFSCCTEWCPPTPLHSVYSLYICMETAITEANM